MIIFFVLLIAVSGQEYEFDPSKPQCPPGTQNAGWFVRRSYAFENPLDCCDNRVNGWTAVDDYDAPYSETGCSLYMPLQASTLSRFVYPSTCSNATSCGEKDFFGNRLECCSNIDSGFCAGVPYTGVSRCDRVAELIEFDKEEDEDNRASEEFSSFASSCYSSNSESEEQVVCLSCSVSCPEGSRLIRRNTNGEATITNRIDNLLREHK